MVALECVFYLNIYFKLFYYKNTNYITKHSSLNVQMIASLIEYLKNYSLCYMSPDKCNFFELEYSH